MTFRCPAQSKSTVPEVASPRAHPTYLNISKDQLESNQELTPEIQPVCLQVSIRFRQQQ